ncbi:MAG: hypothetical protein IPM56_08365 [Ignavibacteriales bacterium]|nr:MAG: hypothetical protein IPM56_08365 [Ignavibacteriales bacterium]
MTELKNVQVCKNCSHENSFHELICRKCKSFLRERIVNLDLWNIVALIIENPASAFRKIIFAEHKNFIFFILFFVVLKILINILFTSLVTIKNYDAYQNFFLNYLIIFVLVLVTILLYSFVTVKLNKKFKLDTRFKDTFAILVFSLLPYALAAVSVFIIELIVFGGYTFSINPSPFQLKPAFAYLLTVIEVGIVLWSVLLTMNGFTVQSGNRQYGLILGLAFHFIILIEIYVSSIILFNF